MLTDAILSHNFPIDCFVVILGDHWYPGIGDPTPIGWFTVVAYLTTAVLCALCALRLSLGLKDKTGGIVWGIIALILVFLGINKQLDLQSWLTIAGKEISQRQGWYNYRRWVQLFFILGIVGTVVVGLKKIRPILAKQTRSSFIGLMGLGFLSSFVIVRAASFHHIDYFIGLNPGGIRMNWVLELGGILAIAIAAIINILPAWPSQRS